MEKFKKAKCNTKCFFEGYVRQAGITYTFPAALKLDQHFDIIINPGAKEEIADKEVGKPKLESLKRPELMKALKAKGKKFTVSMSNNEIRQILRES